MNYKVECTVDTVFSSQQVTEKLTKRILWVQTNEQYNRDVEFQFLNNNVSLLDNIKEGDRVEVTFAIGGRKNEKNGNTRVFNSITAFGIRKV